MGGRSAKVEVEVSGRRLAISSPDKVYFPEIGATKIEVVRYFVAVEEGVLRSLRGRPTAMHRFPDGAAGEGFYYKRIAGKAPDWIEGVDVLFPAAAPGTMLCPGDLAQVLWAVNQGAFELHPWPVTKADLQHPDQLRIDLDPMPDVLPEAVAQVAFAVRDFLTELGLEGFPKRSGGRGVHIHVPIATRWSFTEVRNAAVALAREMATRLPNLVTAEWWKELRGPRVFVDFNQNLRDKTLAGAYTVRPFPHAPVACPVTWDEVATLDPRDLTIRTVPGRFVQAGDPMAAMDAATPGDITDLLGRFARDRDAGVADSPWPPHYPKQEGEESRVAPSRAKKA
jgi:DNA ligase D